MTNTIQAHKKRTYSSFTKYCCQKGVLSKEIEKGIPRSTRHTWCKHIISPIDDHLLAEFESESFDFACISIENEKIKAASAALTEIILLYQKIIDAGNVKKQLLSQSKRLILETIDKLKDIFSIRKICECLAISIHQYYAWKNNMDCKASLLIYAVRNSRHSLRAIM